MIKNSVGKKTKNILGGGGGRNPLRLPLYPERGSATEKMFENNMLSLSVNFICTDRRVNIAPIGLQPDKNLSFGE